MVNRLGIARARIRTTGAVTTVRPRCSDRSRARSTRLIGVLLVVALLASCGGGDADGDDDGNSKTRSQEGESGLTTAGSPIRGGRLVYGLEAETSGGWCLPESQPAISGVMVRRAIYDTLTVDNEKNEPVPSLAKSLTPNETFDEWTFVIRDGVTFHDGSKLDADVVKNNIDAYRGTYEGRVATLARFLLADIDTVTVTGPMTVVVTTKVPWVAFPKLWTILGIMGQAQLEDAENCDTDLIGTGPFVLASWRKDEELLAQRNPNYWQVAPDGKPYPYLDAIAFRPMPDAAQRISALEAGEINAMMTAEPTDIAGPLTDLREDGTINMLVSEEHAEVDYVLLNNSKPPFDDLRMRKAVAMGLDRETFNELTNDGFPTIADQPFPPGDPGYVDDPGFPDHDPEQAKALVEEYRAGGGDPSFTLSFDFDSKVTARGAVIQNQLAEVGIAVKLQAADQATLINQMVGASYEAALVRYFSGGEPDEHMLLLYGKVDSPLNFNRLKSPVIDEAFEEGRSEPDPAKRRAAYERISRDFAENVWDVWLTYTPWAVALSSEVHGIYSVEFPDGHGKPAVSLNRGHPLHGMWIES
jgi:peptide/nickel transport system substrate-binding protein